MKYLKVGVERESRSARRVPVFIHRQDGREIAAILTNISNHGCQLKSAAKLSSDEFVRIEFPHVGGMAARICWAADGAAGAEFIPHSDVWEEIQAPSREGRW